MQGMKQNNNEFIRLLKRVTKENKAASSWGRNGIFNITVVVGDECPVELSRYSNTLDPEAGCSTNPGDPIVISKTEQTLLTKYHDQFLAWLKLQQ
jgi:hypothetical protein